MKMLYIITGPPASGKTTYIRERAQHGDITIDYDALAGTLTPQGGKPHEWPTEVKAVTKAARQAAIDAAIKHSATVDVYVIHSSPSPTLIARYRRLGAQVITIDPGQATVMARAKRERPWQIQQAAKQWYAQRQQTPPTTGSEDADRSRTW